MAYNRELSQFASLITVDDSTSVVGIDTFVGIGTTSPTSTLTVQGNTLITGITTTGSLSIGSTQVISSARQLQNIASLDATTTATIESAIQSAPNTFTDLRVTGISTFTNGPVLIGSATSTGTASQPLQVTGGGYFSSNVGVGVTNPTEKLDIIGSIRLNSSAAERQVIFNNGSTNIYLYGQTSGSGGSVGLYDGTNSRNVLYYTPSNNTLNFGVNSTTLLVGAATSTGTASQPLQVTGGAYFAGVGTATGSIGVGITNPQGAVDIRTSPQWSSFNYAANLVIGGTRNNGLGILDSTNSNPWAIANNSGNLIFAQMPALGNIAIAATEAARITTNRNLLIGSITETGTATQRLQVTGGAYVSGNLGVGNTNPTVPLVVNGSSRFFTSGQGDITISHSNLISNILGASTVQLALGANNTEVIRITAAGNVGIGTTSPTTKLDVSGIGQFTANGATLNLVGTDHSYIQWYPDGIAAGRKAYTGYPNGSVNYFTIANEIADGTGHIYLDPGANAAVLIDSFTPTGTSSQTLQVTGGAYVSGNLGVGVTNPGAKLVVDGDVRLAGLDAEIEFNTGGARLKGRTNALSIHTGGGLDTETSEQVRINTTGVGIGTTNPTSKLHVIGDTRIVGTVTATAFVGDGSGLTNLPGGGGGTNYWVQTAAGIHTLGNVGVGTTNPTTNLQLSPTASISNVGSGITLAGTVGSALTVAQFLYGNGNASYLRIKATRTETGTSWTTASTKLLQVTDVTEQAYIEFNPIGSWSGGSAGLGFGGPSGEWARFNISGNFGIGTTNPGTKLNVVDNSSSDAVRITQLGAGNAFVVEDSTNPDATPFVINAGGAVGIGTTNPTSLLYLGPSNGNTLSHLYLASGNNAFGWRFDTQDFGGGSVPLRIFRRVNGTDTEAITVLNQSGNVGLGSTLPTAALTIATVGSATTGASQIYLNGTTSNRIDFNQNGVAPPALATRSAGTKIVLYPSLTGATVDYAMGVESGHIWQSVASTSSVIGFKWYGGTTELAVLKGNGNLGIGTTNPQAKLHVEGDTLITGILTATNGIQGEAFESYEIDLIGYTGYNLRTEETQIDFTETNDTTTDPYLWGTTVTLPIEDNGFTEDNTFIPFFNSEVVSLANPFRLMITVNGVLQSAFINNTDYVYQSNFLGSRNGYTIDSDNNIKFTESIPTGSDIVARVLPVSGTATKIKNYPFKPTDIVLGY